MQIVVSFIPSGHCLALHAMLLLSLRLISSIAEHRMSHHYTSYQTVRCSAFCTTTTHTTPGGALPVASLHLMSSTTELRLSHHFFFLLPSSSASFLAVSCASSFRRSSGLTSSFSCILAHHRWKFPIPPEIGPHVMQSKCSNIDKNGCH